VTVSLQVQLLHKLKVRAVDGPDALLKVPAQLPPLLNLLPAQLPPLLNLLPAQLPPLLNLLKFPLHSSPLPLPPNTRLLRLCAIQWSRTCQAAAAAS
jgi:hypothetical protein